MRELSIDDILGTADSDDEEGEEKDHKQEKESREDAEIEEGKNPPSHHQPSAPPAPIPTLHFKVG